MRANGAQIIVGMLERLGVDTVSGVPGGAVLPLYDALASSGIRHVLAAHEQGAGFIAQGMARVSGRPGVCLASSGPGVLNLLTALADAAADSVPLVAITGQVARGLIGTDAFQEVDAYALSFPITKHSWLVRDAAELPGVVAEAFRLAVSGRPGPVLIDVPKDVFLQEVVIADWPAAAAPAREAGRPALDPAALRRAAELIRRAKRPLIYAGGGVAAAWRRQRNAGPAAGDAVADLAALARRGDMPVALSFMGLGVFPAGDPLCLGMLGMHAAPSVGVAMERADLVLAVGVRFDDRATGRLDAFCQGAAVVHVDIDPAELGKLRRPDLAINADAGDFLAALLPLAADDPRPDWRAELAAIKRRFPLPAPRRSGRGHFGMAEVLELVRAAAGPDAVIATDVGQHQMWVAQRYPFERPGRLVSSGGMGTMGFGLPAAIGAAMAGSRRVVLVSGDGSLLMNVQELATLAGLGLPVAVVVCNNGQLGLVRQQQDLYYGGRRHAMALAPTDFAQVARGFGVDGRGRFTPADRAGLAAALAVADRPILVDVAVDPAELVLPMVAPGQANRSVAGPWPVGRRDARAEAAALVAIQA